MVERGGTAVRPWLIRFHQPIWLLYCCSILSLRFLPYLPGSLPTEAQGNFWVLYNYISVRLEFAAVEIPISYRL